MDCTPHRCRTIREVPYRDTIWTMPRSVASRPNRSPRAQTFRCHALGGTFCKRSRRRATARRIDCHIALATKVRPASAASSSRESHPRTPGTCSPSAGPYSRSHAEIGTAAGARRPMRDRRLSRYSMSWRLSYRLGMGRPLRAGNRNPGVRQIRSYMFGWRRFRARPLTAQDLVPILIPGYAAGCLTS